MHKIDNRKCAKQTVVAILISGDEFFVGSNWCENPQEICPRRDTGKEEDYSLCESICKLNGHAEVDVCIKAGPKAKGGKLIIIGHDYCCENCRVTIDKYGISEVYILGRINNILP